jgi:hypothetical protein
VNLTKLPTIACVVMALRRVGTSPATLLLQLPGGGAIGPADSGAFGPLRRVNGPGRLTL